MERSAIRTAPLRLAQLDRPVPAAYSSLDLSLNTPTTALALCLLLVRHGETVWNVEGRYQGSTDVPLNAVGTEQARALAVQLQSEHLAAVYSSTLRRALATAEPIAAAHRLTVVRDPRFNEINQGQWEGLRLAEILEHWAELHARWEREPMAVCPPEGETVEAVQSRVLGALADVALSWAGRTVCIVSHKIPLAIIRSVACGTSIADALRVMPANASIERVELAIPPGFYTAALGEGATLLPDDNALIRPRFARPASPTGRGEHHVSPATSVSATGRGDDRTAPSPPGRGSG